MIVNVLAPITNAGLVSKALTALHLLRGEVHLFLSSTAMIDSISELFLVGVILWEIDV